MATTADLRQRTFDNLYSARLQERPFVDLCTASFTSIGTTVTVSDGANWARGDILEPQTTGEQMFVAAVAGNDLTVRRGWNGTTATASAGSDDAVNKNPRITIKQVDDAVTNILRELEGHGIHAWGTAGLTLVADQYDYDISETDVIAVNSVHYLDDDGEIRPLPFSYVNNIGAGTAQGHLLTLYQWGDKTNGDTVYYTYKQRLDNVSKLLTRQEELVVLGATLRLLGATMAPRTHDPGKHSDRTVQAGQGGRDARFYQTEFIMAARREATNLKVEADRQPHNVASSRASRWRA